MSEQEIRVMQPMFSIIIPVYNGAQYLRACLDSILVACEYLSRVEHEDYVEIICVDDGSTDNSARVLDEYSEEKSPCSTRSPRLKIIHKKNEGVSVARNTALKMARGEYVCFVDADDFVGENWLVEYKKAIDESGADLIRSGGTRGRVKNEDLHDWLWRVFVTDGYPWKFSIKRSVALMAEFPAGVVMSEDAIYNARALTHIRSVFELGERYYEHVVREGSAMFRALASNERLSYLKAWQEIVCRLPRDSGEVERSVISHFVTDGILAWLARPKDFAERKAIRELWCAMSRLGCAQAKSVGMLFRGSYCVYALTGLMWPSALWAKTVATIVRAKRVMK